MLNPALTPAHSAPARRLAEALALFALAATFMLLLPASAAAEGGVTPKLLLLARMAGLVLLATWLLHRSGERWRELGLRRPQRWWKTAVTVVVGYLAVGLGVGMLKLLVLPRLGLSAPDVSAFGAIEGDVAAYLYWAIPVAWGSAAFGEELLFRGFLLGRLAQAGGGSPTAVHGAILAQAVLFGSLHAYQGVGGFLATALVGLVMGYAWLFTGRNLWAPILLHGLIDFVSVTAAFNGLVGGR